MQIVEILIKNLERLFYFKSGILRRNATREIDMEEKWRILKSFKFITLFSKKKNAVSLESNLEKKYLKPPPDSNPHLQFNSRGTNILS